MVVQPRSDVPVCLEQGKAAGRIKQTQHEQHARLLPRDPETVPAQQQERPQQQHGNSITEEQDRLNRSPVLHQRNSKQGVQSIRDAGDDTGRITDNGVWLKISGRKITEKNE